MTFAIRIKDSPTNNAWLFERTFATQDDFLAVATLCNNRQRAGFFKSLVVPVRTDNLKNFCKDFFLPTFFDHALRNTHDIGLLIISSIGCLASDLVTLVIRLFTAIPRYYANAKQPRPLHPFHQYLVANGADARLLNTDHVYLNLKYVEGQTGQMPMTWHGFRVNLGSFEEPHKYKKYQIDTEEVFNFIELPQFAGPIQVSQTKRGIPSSNGVQIEQVG